MRELDIRLKVWYQSTKFSWWKIMIDTPQMYPELFLTLGMISLKSSSGLCEGKLPEGNSWILSKGRESN